MTTIAFIGLGHMGLPMAKNLLAAGHAVRAHDLSADALEAASAAGATACGSLGEALSGASEVITMLTSGPVVETVYCGPEGIIAGAAPGALLVDSSTIDVKTARRVAAAAEAGGFDMVDAPVSGGVSGAEAGTLAFMVGGSQTAFDRAETVLEPMAAKIVHAGGSGNGQAAKICNNMLLAISMVGVCEAFTLGRALGLEDQTFYDIAANASGQCWSLTSYCPVPGPVPSSPANRAYQPGFATALMLKDLNLAMDAVTETEAATPLGAHAHKLYTAMADSGHGGMDFSGIINMLKEIG